MKIIDSHIHYSLPVTYENLIETLDKTNTDYCNLVALYDRERGSETIDCLRCKYLGNGRIYTYGSLDLSKYYTNLENIGDCMKEHVKNLMDCGCDGIKMLEGKPTSRNRYPIPNFDLPEWDSYFAYMEEKQIPIVWHVNDPEEFWDINKVPEWAYRSGWYYGEKSINNIDQYNQIENVLKKHPNLVISFAHFYFMSSNDNLNKLSELFDKYPNICVDITPGIEMFHNFSNNITKSKEFFIKYQDRILYGTDISGCGTEGDKEFNIKDSLIRANLCKDYLSKQNDLYIKGDKDSLLGEDDFILKPLGLSKEIQEKILGLNFLRITGKMHEINIPKILDECEREKERIDILSKKLNIKGDYQYINELITFFKKELF